MWGLTGDNIVYFANTSDGYAKVLNYFPVDLNVVSGGHPTLTPTCTDLNGNFLSATHEIRLRLFDSAGAYLTSVSASVDAEILFDDLGLPEGTYEVTLGRLPRTGARRPRVSSIVCLCLLCMTARRACLWAKMSPSIWRPLMRMELPFRATSTPTRRPQLR